MLLSLTVTAALSKGTTTQRHPHMKMGMKFNGAMVGKAVQKAAVNTAKALPYTLTNCAFSGRAKLQSDMGKYINKPTPRTVKGVYYVKAKPTKKPFSEVKFSDLSWKWMKYQVLGGVRTGNTLSAPVAAQKNAFGNVVASQRAKKIANGGAFRATIKGHDGLWQRGSGGLKLMHVYKNAMNYQSRLPMQRIVYTEAAKVFPMHWKKNIKIALSKSVGL